MPYITDERKDELVLGAPFEKPGELNYMLSQTVVGYVEDKGLSYTTFNDVIGVLDALKMEIYRRFTGPYEDTKIDENGDVFPANWTPEDSRGDGEGSTA